jgi:hypothetical protein
MQMAAKLQEMVELLEELKPKRSKARPRGIAKRLLGSCRGLVPKGKTSTEWIRGLRSTLSGKVR